MWDVAIASAAFVTVLIVGGLIVWAMWPKGDK